MKNLIHIIIFMFGISMSGQTFILQEYDKQLHFAAGSFAGVLGYSWSFHRHQNKTKAIITGLCTSLVAGVAKEVYDNSQGGLLDKRDVLATGMGGVFVTVTIPLFQNKKKRSY
ncbi:hypothetical protein N8009_05800 [Flavobacteriaceae bacterium]|nr:hypothetical protein [Flavobacteriaceae bacterium]